MNTEKTGICIFAYTRQGIQTARKAAACLKQENRRITTDTDSEEQLDWIHLYTTEKLLERVQEEQPAMLQGLHLIQQPTVEFYGRCFRQSEALIFIGATGIAVRNIVPHIRDKQTDPAVLCMDELGTFVIPILSGHIGGANQLASEIAQKVGAIPVITTATDIHQKFSVDSWASRNQMIIDDIRIAKQISSTILEQEIPEKEAEALAKRWCAHLKADALGLMFLNRKEGRLSPLVYVPAADTLFWESSCGSGTSAVGAWLALASGKPVTVSLKQPGGVLEIAASPDGSLFLKGTVRCLYEKVVDVEW